MFHTKVVDKIQTHILRSITFCFENRAVCEKMWKNIVERSRPQMKIWCMSIACWMPKATNVNAGCVIIITFLLLQWMYERASMLLLTYIACLVNIPIPFGLGIHKT